MSHEFDSQEQVVMGSRLPNPVVDDSSARLIAQWEGLCKDKRFEDLPYKIETNERAQLLMSPVGKMHGSRQARVVSLLDEAAVAAGLRGELVVEVGVLTTSGVKAPGVAWVSEEASNKERVDSLLTTVPEICVEVMSPPNSVSEMTDKVALYLACGGLEAWIVDAEGHGCFFGASGSIPRSRLMPQFPSVLPGKI